MFSPLLVRRVEVVVAINAVLALAVDQVLDVGVRSLATVEMDGLPFLTAAPAPAGSHQLDPTMAGEAAG
jgi:hypothetical protein